MIPAQAGDLVLQFNYFAFANFDLLKTELVQLKLLLLQFPDLGFEFIVSGVLLFSKSDHTSKLHFNLQFFFQDHVLFPLLHLALVLFKLDLKFILVVFGFLLVYDNLGLQVDKMVFLLGQI